MHKVGRWSSPLHVLHYHTTTPPLPPHHPLHYKNISKADNAIMVKDSFFHLKDKKISSGGKLSNGWAGDWISQKLCKHLTKGEK